MLFTYEGEPVRRSSRMKVEAANKMELPPQMDDSEEEEDENYAKSESEESDESQEEVLEPIINLEEEFGQVEGFVD